MSSPSACSLISYGDVRVGGRLGQTPPGARRVASPLMYIAAKHSGPVSCYATTSLWLGLTVLNVMLCCFRALDALCSQHRHFYTCRVRPGAQRGTGRTPTDLPPSQNRQAHTSSSAP